MSKTAASRRKPVLVQMMPELYKNIMDKKRLTMKQNHRHTLS